MVATILYLLLWYSIVYYSLCNLLLLAVNTVLCLHGSGGCYGDSFHTLVCLLFFCRVILNPCGRTLLIRMVGSGWLPWKINLSCWIKSGWRWWDAGDLVQVTATHRHANTCMHVNALAPPATHTHTPHTHTHTHTHMHTHTHPCTVQTNYSHTGHTHTPTGITSCC